MENLTVLQLEQALGAEILLEIKMLLKDKTINPERRYH